VREENGGGRCRGHSNVDAQAGFGSRTTQLFSDRSRLADEAAEPTDVECDRAIAVRLDTRRKIPRDLD
jgi:hypothetical protein